MTDEELIVQLRAAPADGLGTENLCIAGADRIEALVKERDQWIEHTKNAVWSVEQYRNTNRRMNRRVQMLEGWWQRRLERANYWRGLYLWGMRRKDLNVKAIEEAAYQRGYEDGFEEKFRMPKLWARPRRINSGVSK